MGFVKGVLSRVGRWQKGACYLLGSLKPNDPPDKPVGFVKEGHSRVGRWQKGACYLLGRLKPNDPPDKPVGFVKGVLSGR